MSKLKKGTVFVPAVPFFISVFYEYSFLQCALLSLSAYYYTVTFWFLLYNTSVAALIITTVAALIII